MEQGKVARRVWVIFMGEFEVARFERAGDVRRMSVAREGGGIVLREDLSGPSTLIAYGDKERSLRIFLEPAALDALIERIGFSGGEGSLWDFLTRERYDLADLMDLCDRTGIPYVFTGMGDRSGLQFRPARADCRRIAYR